MKGEKKNINGSYLDGSSCSGQVEVHDNTYLHTLHKVIPIRHVLLQWVLALLIMEEQLHMVTFLEEHCVHVCVHVIVYIYVCVVL